MALPRYENENQLRQLVRAAWGQPFSIGHALIVKGHDRFELAASFRKFASELGARFVVLDIEGETLPADQVELLSRKGPRIVFITGLEQLSEEQLAKFPETINAGGRAMPVFPVIEEASEPDAFGGDEDDEDTPPFDVPTSKEGSEEAAMA